MVIKLLGYDIKKATKEFENFIPYETMGALQVLQKETGDVLFYNQSRRGALAGMQSAFNDLKRLKIDGKIVALIGGIYVLKDDEWAKILNKEVAKLINESNIKRLFTTGANIKYLHDNLKDKSILISHSNDLDYLAQRLIDEVEGGDLLFIMGSAYLYLNRVANKIFQRVPSRYFDYRIGLVNRGKILYEFFKNVDKTLQKIDKFENVNEFIINKNKVYNKEFCTRWFYNKINKEKSKEIFGTFFYFYSPFYLLFICAATKHFHIGLVRYKKVDGKIELEKISENEVEKLNEMYAIYSKEKLVYRKWNNGWASIDLGDFNNINDFFNKNTVKDFLKGL